MQTKEFLKKLKKYGEENDIPNISEKNAEYLLSIVKKIKAKNILEIGTANGYSTIHFATCVTEWGGKVTTIEFSSLSQEKAKNNFAELELDNIVSILGNAIDVLPTLKEKYDFIFIDGMKKRSRDFLELCLDKISTGGVIVIDDVIKFRSKMESLYTFVEDKKIPHTIVQVDDDDGVMILEF